MLYFPLLSRATRCASCRPLSLGCLPCKSTLALATFRPSLVRSRIQNSGHRRRARQPCLLFRNGFRAPRMQEVRRHVRTKS